MCFSDDSGRATDVEFFAGAWNWVIENYKIWIKLDLSFPLFITPEDSYRMIKAFKLLVTWWTQNSVILFVQYLV